MSPHLYATLYLDDDLRLEAGDDVVQFRDSRGAVALTLQVPSAQAARLVAAAFTQLAADIDLDDADLKAGRPFTRRGCRQVASTGVTA